MLTSDKPLPHDELIRRIRPFVAEVTVRKNKCFLFHPNINGKPQFITLHVPHGRKKEHSRSVVGSVRRRFNVSIEKFYE